MLDDKAQRKIKYLWERSLFVCLWGYLKESASIFEEELHCY